MNKVQNLSRFFKRVFAVIFVGWPIVLAFIWFGNQRSFPAGLGLNIANLITPDLYNSIMVPMSGSLKFWGFMVSCIPMAVGMTLAWLFIKLFSCYEHAEIFTLQSTSYIKKIGLVLIVGVILNVIYETLMTFVMTSHNPVGYRFINVYIGAGDIRNLITAGLVFLIAYIMQEGVKLREEQALTV